MQQNQGTGAPGGRGPFPQAIRILHRFQSVVGFEGNLHQPLLSMILGYPLLRRRFSVTAIIGINGLILLVKFFKVGHVSLNIGS